MLSSKPLTRATGSALSAVFRRVDAMMGATIATSNDSMEDEPHWAVNVTDQR